MYVGVVTSVQSRTDNHREYTITLRFSQNSAVTRRIFAK